MSATELREYAQTHRAGRLPPGLWVAMDPRSIVEEPERYAIACLKKGRGDLLFLSYSHLQVAFPKGKEGFLQGRPIGYDGVRHELTFHLDHELVISYPRYPPQKVRRIVIFFKEGKAFKWRPA